MVDYEYIIDTWSRVWNEIQKDKLKKNMLEDGNLPLTKNLDDWKTELFSIEDTQ